ncbi:hypothetical protein WJX81_001529 [Elliptochloris bilobata]|uniref:Uncharacterized protein n=1 Tax=Elliptochloris bilobata TaxID=381761 RepID=A0AAW1RRZ0_9CHLO
MAPSWMLAVVVAALALLAQSICASRELQQSTPELHRAKNDAGICYSAEGYFGNPNRKECQQVGQYKFYYTCCEERKPDDAVNRLFDPSTYRRVFGGNDCLQQPDSLVSKCRGSKDHEFCCTRKRA